ncbi:glucose-6-phosphate isomerase [Parasporobacterium paucivorans]|uniref:glucose-6-phosphate isomerase n=1 Tax=Parasporobacterium paucivorans TaxID=115544 RepID=UPI0038CDC009
MPDIIFDYENAKGFFGPEELVQMEEKVKQKHKMLLDRSGSGSEFLGWIDIPERYDREEFEKIKSAAQKIRKDSDVLVVIGIGGSYLGARAAIEFLQGRYPGYPEVYFAGNNLSSTQILEIKQRLEGRDFSLNVISKSGTTTEPAIAFRFFKRMIQEKYGKAEASGRIYVTTDKNKGALKELAGKEGYTTFVVPDDIGGRYSVLTAVGLLPIAAAGADVDELMAGAALGRNKFMEAGFESNDALQYAAVRNILLEKGKNIEILAGYEPCLHYVAEWWKQLFGESEGKDGKGIFPAAVDLTSDLHSMGQYIQDGQRCIFETVLDLSNTGEEILVGEEEDDLDGLNYLAEKTVDFVNRSAMKGAIKAHVDGGVPNLKVTLAARNERTLGELFYFFESACGVSGYVLGVNPFDQPGVEFYKKNMFTLLGKPEIRQI